jgi:hypothetical protein
MSIITLPWGIKILYGLISDNVTLCGTKRKSYILIMGLLQFLCCNILFVAHSSVDIFYITAILTVVSFAEAFTNVASDALMVIQSRIDPENGSQNLVAF